MMMKEKKPKRNLLIYNRETKVRRRDNNIVVKNNK